MITKFDTQNDVLVIEGEKYDVIEQLAGILSYHNFNISLGFDRNGNIDSTLDNDIYLQILSHDQDIKREFEKSGAQTIEHFIENLLEPLEQSGSIEFSE